MILQFLKAANASIAYQVEGSGPLLFLVGAPVGIAGFEPLAQRLATDFTIVRHDPRGIGQSTIEPGVVPSPQLLGRDLAALIEELGGAPATVFGSSGGAVTGLELIASRAELVGRLIVHEPPIFALLDDGAELLRQMDEAFALADRDPQAAMQGFADLTEALHSWQVLTPRPPRIVLPPAPASELER